MSTSWYLATQRDLEQNDYLSMYIGDNLEIDYILKLLKDEFLTILLLAKTRLPIEIEPGYQVIGIDEHMNEIIRYASILAKSCLEHHTNIVVFSENKEYHTLMTYSEILEYKKYINLEE